MKYICIFRLVLRCLLAARKENLTGVSTGLTGRSKNLDPTGNPTGRPDRFPSLIQSIGYCITSESILNIDFLNQIVQKSKAQEKSSLDTTASKPGSVKVDFGETPQLGIFNLLFLYQVVTLYLSLVPPF